MIVSSQTPKPGAPTRFFNIINMSNHDNRSIHARDTSPRKRKQLVPSKPVTAFDEFLI